MTKKNECKAPVQVGGQAVIEGVMMRAPSMFSVAVRRPDGSILLRKEKYLSWTRRIKWFGWPFIRGGIILIESLVLGIKALNFSADIAVETANPDSSKGKTSERSPLWTGLTVVLALGLGIGLFFFLPLLLTELTGVKSGILFNLIDGALRLSFFLIYVVLISRWKEIRRIFEYHGAEHKSIFAFEDGKPLTLQAVKAYTTHHPRCGTSFLLIVMMVSLIIFIFLGRPQQMSDRLIRFLFIPVIGGLSYEIIRLSSTPIGRKLSRILVAPGLWLQRITTQEPDDSQLEVALVALKGALDAEVPDSVEYYQKPKRK